MINTSTIINQKRTYFHYSYQKWPARMNNSNIRVGEACKMPLPALFVLMLTIKALHASNDLTFPSFKGTPLYNKARQCLNLFTNDL